MKLMGSLTSPFVRKVRIVFAEKKLDYQLIQVDPWQDDAQLTANNPLGQVPCLIMEGGEAVFDSRVIVEYLDTLSPVSRLIPSAGRERVEVKQWEAISDGVVNAAILARLEQTWPGRQEAERSQAWVNRQLAKSHAGVAAIAGGLGDRPYCVGRQFTLADIAVGATLEWLAFRFPEQAWLSDHPALEAWLQHIRQRLSFQLTVPKG